MAISTSYQEIVKTAVKGQYEHEFFGPIHVDQAIAHCANFRRLRAVIQHLNLQFATTMRMHGRKTKIIPEEKVKAKTSEFEGMPELDQSYALFSELQEEVKRSDAVERVRMMLVRSRGCELSGTFNPLLISQLFWQQSANWKMIASHHIEEVVDICTQVVRAAVEHCAPSDIAERLRSLALEEAVGERAARANAELNEIIADSKHRPITYDPTYISTVRLLKYEKQLSKHETLLSGAEENINGSNYLKPDVVKDVFRNFTEPDMDKASAEDALNSEEAYYKVHHLCHHYHHAITNS